MNRKKTRLLVIDALLAAICLVLGLTPLGYIPIGPLKITIMCLPVIIGTLTTGLKSGVFLGGVFALTSIMQIFIAPNPLYTALFVDALSWVKIFAVCIAPRLLVPVAANLAYRGMDRLLKRRKSILSVAVAAGAGSVTNTVFFLGLFWVLFAGDAALLDAEVYAIFLGTFTAAVSLNAVVEIIAACAVCPPVILALRRAYPHGYLGKEES